jgi:uncharacterized repeat protein (TIGR01451 family)
VSKGSAQRVLDRRVMGIAAAGVLAIFGLLTLLAGASRGAPSPSGSADLSLTKSDSPDPVATGGALAYSIQVTNAGPDAATNVIVTDNLPKGVSFISAVSTQGSCSTKGKSKDPTLTCALGTLASSVGPVYLNPVTITIRVLAPQKAGTISNPASVTSDLKDPKSANNSATATTRVIQGTGSMCSGHRATIVGTSGDDVLVGSAGNDAILARAGNDQVFSLAGNDLVCAGAGNDLVKSGAGPDGVSGGSGADRLFGRGGSDVLRGGRGPDRLRGGRGPDLLVGGIGNDRCSGGPGRDTLRSC